MIKRIFEIDIPPGYVLTADVIQATLCGEWKELLTVCEVTDKVAYFPTTEQLKVAFDTETMDG